MPPTPPSDESVPSAAPPAPPYRRDEPGGGGSMLEQPLPAARQDLQVSPQLYLGRTVHVVKDPVGLTYFRLKPAEHYVLRHLDGQVNARQLAERAAKRFPDQTITAGDVMNFVGMLHGTGLLLGRGESHGQWLRETRDKRKRKRRIAQWTNFLFIKIPVLDPDRLLDGMYGSARLVMNRWTMWLAVMFMAVSAAAVIPQLYRVGDLAFPLLGWTNLLMLSVTFFVVKVIHEFGHGLAAKHRGLEVHEMGVMLMVFFPLFYVDVSDAWMVPRRRDRMWITAGGVFIEFLFAAAAAWVWLLTDPGTSPLLHQSAFNIMLAASVTTVLFNANPLLRYDGYYFLMDWLEIPNLKTKSQKYLGYLAKRYVLRMPGQVPPAEAATRPIFMPLFAVASAVYRWLVVFGIIALVWHILDPYGLEVLGAMMGSVAIVTMVLLPIFKMLRFVWSQQAKTWRRLGVSAVAMAVLGLAIWGVLSIPWEQTVEQPLVALAEERKPLYVPVTGRVAEVFFESGETLEAGEPILRLTDDKLDDRLRELEVERRMADLERDTARQEGRIASVAAAENRIEQIDRRIEHFTEKIEELVVRAPLAGRLQPDYRLQALIGRSLDAGDRLGVMVGEGRPNLVLILPQADASIVRADMDVRVRLWGDPSQTYHGRIRRVGSQFLQHLPHEGLSSRYHGEVDTVEVDRYNTKPAAPSVVAEIALDPDQGSPPTDGMTGRGKIVIGRSTIGEQQWRAVRQALSLDWWL